MEVFSTIGWKCGRQRVWEGRFKHNQRMHNALEESQLEHPVDYCWSERTVTCCS